MVDVSRILQAANFVAPNSGGIRTVLDRLAAGYGEAGHEVVQLVPGARPTVTETPWGRRITVRGVPVPRTGYRLMSYRTATEVIASVRPDRLEVHDRSTLRGLGRWARRRSIRSMIISHERLDRLARQWLPDTDRMRRLIDRSNAWLGETFDEVLCTTDWAAEEFRAVGVPVMVVPLGVDLDRFRPGADAALRNRLAPSGSLLVLASRLSREKRPDLAVRATAELLQRRAKVTLAVAGDGPQLRHLERLAWGMPVIFTGYLNGSDLPRLLATADVAIAPGPVETFGLAALEALASGTPVVANAESALPSVLGPAGLAVAPTPTAFADAVEALLARPAAARSSAARTRAESFDWARTVRRFLAAHDLGRLAETRP
jgi:alpha-1,6-mannosyltransferase